MKRLGKKFYIALVGFSLFALIATLYFLGIIGTSDTRWTAMYFPDGASSERRHVADDISSFDECIAYIALLKDDPAFREFLILDTFSDEDDGFGFRNIPASDPYYECGKNCDNPSNISEFYLICEERISI